MGMNTHKGSMERKEIICVIILLYQANKLLVTYVVWLNIVENQWRPSVSPPSKISPQNNTVLPTPWQEPTSLFPLVQQLTKYIFISQLSRLTATPLISPIKPNEQLPAMTESPTNPPTLQTQPHPQPQSKSQSQISSPRRLLILSPSTQSTSIIPPFLHSLTGAPVTDPPTSTPTTQGETTGEKPGTSFAGYTTHAPFSIRNKYYSAEVPVWVDEVPLSHRTGTETGDSLRGGEREGKEEGNGAEQIPPSPSLWKTEFCSAEAKVVRDAIGGIVVCVLNPEDHSSTLPSGSDSEDPRQRTDVQGIKEYIQSIASVKAKIEEERETIGDVAGLVVLVGKKQLGKKSGKKGNDDEGILDDLSPEGGDDEQPFTPTWWEDQLSDLGVMEFEVVDWDPRSDGDEERRNEFGGLSYISSPSSFLLQGADKNRTPRHAPDKGSA